MEGSGFYQAPSFHQNPPPRYEEVVSSYVPQPLPSAPPPDDEPLPKKTSNAALWIILGLGALLVTTKLLPRGFRQKNDAILLSIPLLLFIAIVLIRKGYGGGGSSSSGKSRRQSTTTVIYTDTDLNPDGEWGCIPPPKNKRTSIRQVDFTPPGSPYVRPPIINFTPAQRQAPIINLTPAQRQAQEKDSRTPPIANPFNRSPQQSVQGQFSPPVANPYKKKPGDY